MIRAVLILCAAAGRTMSARGGGSIINVSSTSGFITMDNYSAIKAWVTTYSEGLATELRANGVRVTALCPGYVRTEFHQRASIRTGSIPRPMWVNVDELVSEALADVAKGKIISIPTRRFKVMIFVARHAPRAAVRALSERMNSNRH